MLLRALGLALDQSVEALARQMQRAGQYTSSAENTQLLTRYGLTPVLGEQCTLAPYVMLVDYAHLPPLATLRRPTPRRRLAMRLRQRCC